MRIEQVTHGARPCTRSFGPLTDGAASSSPVAVEPTAAASKRDDVRDTFAGTADVYHYRASDLDENGELHVIVYSQRHRDLSTLRHRIKASHHGSGIDRELPLVNGFSAHIAPRDLHRVLGHLPSDVRVHINRMIEYPDPVALVKDAPPQPGSPPPPAVNGLDPSRAVIGIQKVWDQGFTGKGVGVAIIDSGIYPHPDIKDHIKGWVDIADGKARPYDKFGHGTHVAGDVAGSGVKSAGRFKGIAPDADLIGVRITTVAEAIKGIQWCIDNKDKYNIRILNMSLGDFATKSYKDDPWAQAAEKAIDAGLIVVVAAGNEGPDGGTISTPGTDPRVITVGALDDKHTVDRSDDQVASFSSHGPTTADSLTKPDIIAPGVQIYAPLDPGSTLDVPELPHVGKDYIAISGTSMATPFVSGLIADMLQANPNLKHNDVKKILEASADRFLPDGADAQGYGLINAPRALQMALAMKNGAPAPDVPPLPVEPPTAAKPAPTAAKPAPRSNSARLSPPTGTPGIAGRFIGSVPPPHLTPPEFHGNLHPAPRAAVATPKLADLRTNLPSPRSSAEPAPSWGGSVNVDGYLLSVGRRA